ncbi:hypothetical protein SAMN06295974_3880 [Plantibacter flavus]|uniref:Uncharacterized protein n=2 Tax=Plantibacter flavus TaxID=150123 RepID=A0A3N2BL31_9MICO|nr:hypothetical protein EDD42_3926 [Plantibacter flavus]SMG49691.1 hypothetical protein SAMN06295974_3880 [Plantibacter flavus]
MTDHREEPPFRLNVGEMIAHGQLEAGASVTNASPLNAVAGVLEHAEQGLTETDATRDARMDRFPELRDVTIPTGSALRFPELFDEVEGDRPGDTGHPPVDESEIDH